MDKGGDVFLDQLARLGVINKVSTLAGPTSDDENEEEAKPEKVRLAHIQLIFVVLKYLFRFADMVELVLSRYQNFSILYQYQ